MIREHPMIRVRLFKKRRNEVKVDPKLGGQWKAPCLGAMEGSMLGGNGRFHAWWPMEGEGKTPFHLFPFSSNKFYLNLQFCPLTLRFYFTMVLSRYSCLFFLFLNL